MRRAILLCILALAMFVCVPLLHAKEAGPGITADAAMNVLKEGNQRFIIGKQNHPNQAFDRRDSTAQKGRNHLQPCSLVRIQGLR